MLRSLLFLIALSLVACTCAEPPPPTPTPQVAQAEKRAKKGRKGGKKGRKGGKKGRKKGRKGGKKDGPDEQGWWREFRTHRFDPNMTDEQKKELEALEAIGYVSGSKEGASSTGVVRNDGDKTWGELNFYTSGHAPEAILMNNKGDVLHTWKADFDTIWPEFPVKKSHNSRSCLRRAHLFPNGDVIAIFGGLGMVKIDKDSKVLWALPNRAHHDVAVADNGDVYVLTRQAHIVERVNKSTPVMEDFLVILDKDGKEKQTLSMIEVFENSEEHRWIWDKKSRKRGDVLHTNSVEILDGSLASKIPAFKKGNVLLSFRANHAIAVVDPAQKKVVWAHHGGSKKDYLRQHDPSVLPNGNLLIFDNKGIEKQSTVEEYDPVTMQQGWTYKGTETDPFFSATCGAAARLPNGNTMITESDNGRAFEVTKDGEIVWEFLNPARAGEDGRYIAALFEVYRYPADYKTW